jgi:large subunit ribosomal protein L2
MPSGEIRLFLLGCRATIGSVGNEEQGNQSLGKAGRSRHLGRKPKVRGVAQNPNDHPMGGGEGKSSGGRHPVSKWGTPSKGYRTRKHKPSDRLIIRRRSKS